MFTLTKALEKALLQHFIYTKLDIAYAINKPFPFFEALRDNSFITETMYKESLEACRNLVPLSKVVHKLLTCLELTFHPSLLLTLFSQVNLREYPRLVAIFRSFRNVGYAYEERNRPTPTLLEAPANPAEGCSLQTLMPPPLLQPWPPSHPSSALRVCVPRATLLPITEILDEQPSPSPRAVPLPGCIQEGKTTPVSSRDHQRKDKEDSREMPHSPSGSESVVKDILTSKTNKQEDSGAQPRGSPGTTHVVQADSPAANDLEMTQEAPYTPANKKARKRKSYTWSYSKRRRQKKKPPQDETTEISKEASKTSGGKRPQKRPSTTQRTTNIPEKSEDDAVDFLSPTLPVTCGKAKGTLFKEKLKQGSSKKCIQNEAGAWFTVKEFLNEGGKAKSKDWKKAIHCNGKPLRRLEQEGLLFCTSKSKPQKKGA